MHVLTRFVTTAVIFGLLAGCGERPPAAEEPVPSSEPAAVTSPEPEPAAVVEAPAYEREVKKAISRRLPAPPAIDGAIGPEWEGAERQPGFFLSGVEASRKAEFMVGHDDANLYVVGIFEETSPEKMRLQANERDGSNVWQDDCMELFIDPGNTKEVYYQMIASATGVQYDGMARDRSWNAEWQSAARIADGRWVAEVAIPFSAFGADAPKPGEEWGFNVARNDNVSGENSQWSDTWGNNHWPELFGVLVFAE